MIKHLACIMDGNRRWAKKRGWLPWDGHREGIHAAERVVNFCLDNSIAYLSLYLFSLENFRRSEQEQHFLFNVLLQEFKHKIETELMHKGVRLCFIGEESLFPSGARKVCKEIEAMTAGEQKLQVNLLFCYGGRQEILHGVKRVAQEVKEGVIAPEDVTDALFEKYLWTAGTPPPDIIVRTGGAHRLSNFLLFQAAYSELFFLDCLWPELTPHHLEKVIASFYERQRNFGI